MEVEKKNVPENILKKQARDSKVRDEKAKVRKARKESNSKLRAEYLKRG